jgi:4-hydroxybenzoate polyprenyltransferase
VTGGLLAWEHSIVRPSDLSRVNTAFFTLNGVVSLALMAFLAADVFLGGAA